MFGNWYADINSSIGKEPTCNAEDPCSILGPEEPLERDWLLTPLFWPGEFHGLYSPWDRKKLDMTE